MVSNYNEFRRYRQAFRGIVSLHLPNNDSNTNFAYSNLLTRAGDIAELEIQLLEVGFCLELNTIEFNLIMIRTLRIGTTVTVNTRNKACDASICSFS